MTPSWGLRDIDPIGDPVVFVDDCIEDDVWDATRFFPSVQTRGALIVSPPKTISELRIVAST
jgi:hypothetical protein